jgi:adenine-specific DNA-methyltransferase
MLALQELAVTRQARISTVKASHKEEFAQYLTPLEIARYMAELTLRYKETDMPQFGRPIVILDPGAGSGILAGSLVNFLQRKRQNIPLSLEAWEIDPTIFDTLDQTLNHLGVPYTIRREDFISQMSHEIYWKLNRQYDLIIMNPPYKKINSGAIYRSDLHDIDIETVNTYSAFIAIAVKLLAEGGILTAIVPRSFCNGLYFLPFRKFLNANIVIRHIHSFEKRDNAFADEKVLQENIIITLQKSKDHKKPITISHSVDKVFSGYFEFSVPYKEIISPTDPQLYISIPKKKSKIVIPLLYRNTDLGFDVSTGPIVDFRSTDKLIYGDPKNGIPLLYSVHMRNQTITWPVESKKPNAILLDNSELEKNAFKTGYYILIKRFSSKEEKRRIYATLLTPDNLHTAYFTAENHLNIIHCKHGGLDKNFAKGLTAYFNTEFCDNIFREFSGHTQVNATDLRNMWYPSRETLIKFGRLVQGKNIDEYDTIYTTLNKQEKHGGQ